MTRYRHLDWFLHFTELAVYIPRQRIKAGVLLKQGGIFKERFSTESRALYHASPLCREHCMAINNATIFSLHRTIQ